MSDIDTNMRVSPVDDCTWMNESATIFIEADTPELARAAAGMLESNANNHNTPTEQVRQLREEIDELKKDKFQLVDAAEYLHKKLIEEGNRYAASINRKMISKLLDSMK